MATKILVIEDEQAVREMLFYALNKADFEVREAANGEIALDILKKYKYNSLKAYFLIRVFPPFFL